MTSQEIANLVAQSINMKMLMHRHEVLLEPIDARNIYIRKDAGYVFDHFHQKGGGSDKPWVMEIAIRNFVELMERFFLPGDDTFLVFALAPEPTPEFPEEARKILDLVTSAVVDSVENVGSVHRSAHEWEWDSSVIYYVDNIPIRISMSAEHYGIDLVVGTKRPLKELV